MSAFAFMCVLFCGIQFIKSSRKIRKNYQQNIVTFNQNFYFIATTTTAQPTTTTVEETTTEATDCFEGLVIKKKDGAGYGQIKERSFQKIITFLETE